MFKPKNPMMAAYLIFLLICAIWQGVCEFLGTDFTNWRQLITAVTISSYFISFNSVFTTGQKLNQKLLIAFKESVGLLEYALKYDKLFDIVQYNPTCYEEVETLIEHEKDSITNLEKSLSKIEFWIFVCTLLSFLVFFCVITFNGIFLFFEKSQDLYTLIAFIIVLFADYIETNIVDQFDEKLNELKDLTEKTSNMLEEKRNGQAEDAHAE